MDSVPVPCSYPVELDQYLEGRDNQRQDGQGVP